MELPYYRYEFERKKRRLEEKRRSDGWLNDEVRYGAICHDSRGNLVDGLGNFIKEAEIEFQTDTFYGNPSHKIIIKNSSVS